MKITSIDYKVKKRRDKDMLFIYETNLWVDSYSYSKAAAGFHNQFLAKLLCGRLQNCVQENFCSMGTAVEQKCTTCKIKTWIKGITLSNHKQFHFTLNAHYLRSVQTYLAMQNTLENTDCQKTHK